MATVKFDTWVNNNLGKQIDYDGVSGVQCVDLIKHYIKNVLGTTPQSIGNAIEYYNKRNGSYLSGLFKWIDNTASFIPSKGDIAVFKNSTYGHVSVCTGEGTTSMFYSYDQNWSGKAMAKVKHTYTGDKFLGVLRPKDQSNITTATSASSTKTMYVATNTDNLNVRDSASTSGKKLTSIAKGTKVTVTKTSGSWSYITSPTAGWVSTQYLSSTAPAATVYYKVTTKSRPLNCRESAKSNASIVGAFAKGAKLTYLNKSSGNWLYVTGTSNKNKTITGYCNKSYLTKC